MSRLFSLAFGLPLIWSLALPSAQGQGYLQPEDLLGLPLNALRDPSSLAPAPTPSLRPTSARRADPETLRLLRALEAGEGEDPPVRETIIEPTHRSAPLASTGPQGPLTVLFMGGSILWTLARAKRLEKWRK